MNPIDLLESPTVSEADENKNSRPLFWGIIAVTKRLKSHVVCGKRVDVLDVKMVHHKKDYIWVARTNLGTRWVRLRGGFGGIWETLKKEPRP